MKNKFHYPPPYRNFFAIFCSKSANLILDKFHPKGLKIVIEYWIWLKKGDREGITMDQKGLKMVFLDKKYLFLDKNVWILFVELEGTEKSAK